MTRSLIFTSCTYNLRYRSTCLKWLACRLKNGGSFTQNKVTESHMKVFRATIRIAIHVIISKKFNCRNFFKCQLFICASQEITCVCESSAIVFNNTHWKLKTMMHQHIDTWTNWTPFWRGLFPIKFREGKCNYCVLIEIWLIFPLRTHFTLC